MRLNAKVAENVNNNIAMKPFSVVVFVGVCKKYISKNLEFSVKLFIFASTRKKRMSNDKKTLPLGFRP